MILGPACSYATLYFSSSLQSPMFCCSFNTLKANAFCVFVWLLFGGALGHYLCLFAQSVQTKSCAFLSLSTIPTQLAEYVVFAYFKSSYVKTRLPKHTAPRYSGTNEVVETIALINKKEHARRREPDLGGHVQSFSSLSSRPSHYELC